jgi:hypothetical protein
MGTTPKEIAQGIHRAEEWIDLLEEAVQEAERVMQAQRSLIAPAGGFPTYNHEVVSTIISRLACLYPEVSLPKA